MKRILIVDDNNVVQDVLNEFFKDRYVVQLAPNASQALSLIVRQPPDLVLLDVKMPGLDGLSLGEQIGERRLAAVVMLTAFSQRELVERARDAGALAYVVKPFTRADLVPAVEIALSRWQQIKALEREVADLGERFETRKRVDRAKGVLMKSRGLTEDEAYKALRKHAMDTGRPIHAVAADILAISDLLKPGGEQ